MVIGPDRLRSIAPPYAVKDAARLDSFSEPQIPALLQRDAEDDHDNTVVPSSERQAPEPAQEKKASPSISEEWEKLIIIDEPCLLFQLQGPVIPQAPGGLHAAVSGEAAGREDLQDPRARGPKAKQRSTNRPWLACGVRWRYTLVKKPLLPFEPRASQPLKPSFNRVRRKAVS
ncbi:hypothetical protein ZWY2020_059819 [Hordeum vulgare]|nr:hypothetical protein ZWY2020_059819 [Hordeum vulgare]